LSEDYAAVDPLPPTPEPAVESRARAEADWDRLVLFGDWLKQLWSDYGVTLSDTQKKLAVDYLVTLNLSPLIHESWNIIRRRMVAAHQFPLAASGYPALTIDERFASMVEDFDLSTPEGRRHYASEMGRLKSVMPLVKQEQD
jgi:hypothetical protein